MQKIDRLGWVAGFAFESYGVRVGVRVNRPEAVESVVPRLPHGWKPLAGAPAPLVDRLYSLVVGGEGERRGVRRMSLLYEDIRRTARARDASEVLERFESAARLYVAEMTRRRVFVHAGAVGWRGRAVVIPGRSRSGKTTLVAELVRLGATYYSDEFAVLDARARAHPFLKPLAVRENGGGRQKNYSVEELGGTAGRRALPVGLVVVAEYKPGARWRPRRLSAGQGALALLDNTVSARRQPEKVLTVLRQVVGRAPVLRGARGEARETARAVLAYLDEQERIEQPA